MPNVILNCQNNKAKKNSTNTLIKSKETHPPVNDKIHIFEKTIHKNNKSKFSREPTYNPMAKLKIIIRILACLNILFVSSSCTQKQELDLKMKKLVNEVLVPINFTHLVFRYNVQLKDQEQIASIIEYTKFNEFTHEKLQYEFNEIGKLAIVNSISDKERGKLKTHSFEYDTIGRLVKFEDFRKEIKAYNFRYNKKGLVSEVVDDLGKIQLEFLYEYNNDGSIKTLTQKYPDKEQTSRYHFAKIGNDFKNYTLDFYLGSKLTYKSMRFYFNQNLTMKEVFGEKFNTHGIPIQVYSKKGARKIHSKLDSKGNWVEQQIGGSQETTYREIEYK